MDSLFTKEPNFIKHFEGGDLPIFNGVSNKPPMRGAGVNNRGIFYKVCYRVALPFYTFIRYWLIDGFIERQIINWMRRYISEGTVVELGMGDGRLLRHVPESCHYLGFDMDIREDLLRVAKQHGKARLFVASAVDIPLTDNSADFLISTEVMEHIVGVDKAIKEMYRIAKPGAKLLLSIPNNYSYKYARKGPHPEHINNWGYQQFISAMSPYFGLVESRMNGWWLPWFPNIRYSYQIGWSHPNEYYNTNFLFVFKSLKKSLK